MKLSELTESRFDRYDLPETEDEWMEAVIDDPTMIKYKANPSEALQLAAIENVSWEKCHCVVGQVFSFIKNPTEAVKVAAIKKDGYLLQTLDVDPLWWNDKDIKTAAINDLNEQLVSAWFSSTYKTDLKNIASSIKNLKAKRCPWSELNQIAAELKKPSEATLVKMFSPDNLRTEFPMQALADHLEKNRVALDWSWLTAKRSIIAALINGIKGSGISKMFDLDVSHSDRGAARLIRVLKKLKCPWPEIAAIDKMLSNR